MPIVQHELRGPFLQPRATVDVRGNHTLAQCVLPRQLALQVYWSGRRRGERACPDTTVKSLCT